MKESNLDCNPKRQSHPNIVASYGPEFLFVIDSLIYFFVLSTLRIRLPTPILVIWLVSVVRRSVRMIYQQVSIFDICMQKVDEMKSNRFNVIFWDLLRARELVFFLVDSTNHPVDYDG